MILLGAGSQGTLHPMAERAVLPYALGVVKRATAIPIQVGESDTLAVAIASAGTPATITVSRSAVVAKCPDSGVLQIENERWTYTSRNPSARTFSGLTRAAQGTSAAAHARGVTVYLVVDEHVYAVAEAPGLHRHASIDAVYVNGVAIPVGDSTLPYVAEPNDAALYDGRVVATVRFNLSAVNAIPRPPTGSGDVQQPIPLAAPERAPWPLPRLLHTRRGPAFLHRLADAVEAVLGGWARPLANQAGRVLLGYHTGTGAPLPPPAVAPSLAAPLQVGTVQVDLTGLEDDDSGTISGTPNLLLDNPADALKLIGREAYGGVTADFDATSWAEARAAYASVNGRWGMLVYPQPFSQLRETAGLNCQSDLFIEGTTWRLLVRKDRPSAYTFDARNTLGVPVWNWTPATELVTRLRVGYRVDGEDRTGVLDADAARVGIRAGELGLSWILAEEVVSGTATYPPASVVSLSNVELVARHWLQQWARPKLILQLTGAHEAWHLERGDVITVDGALLDTLGVAAVTCQVRGLTVHLDEGTIDVLAVEQDPAAAFGDLLGLLLH